MFTFLVRMALRWHNLSYKLSSTLAIKAEGGIHPKHRLMNYHQFFLDHITQSDRVLDIGCGNGVLAYDLADVAAYVMGIDLNEKNRHAWENRFARKNLEYHIADATIFSPEEHFDVVVLSNVLEHIERRVEFLQRIKHLAPLFLIRVPMIDRDWITLYKKEIGIEYRLDMTHFTEYTLQSFTDEIQEAGFTMKSSSIQFGEIWAVVYSHPSSL
ncbi:class I SAM-dependent methyltransferase [Patescibacteria group bacterium]|nr:MAG: class I SAM-dependent methyltransferase [Patescibacteria group bacterium]